MGTQFLCLKKNKKYVIIYIENEKRNDNMKDIYRFFAKLEKEA